MAAYTQNRLLSSLSHEKRDLLLSHCTPVDLPLKTSLYRAMMQGARRTTVTLIAGSLQRDGSLNTREGG
jgi:hypothetical protein